MVKGEMGNHMVKSLFIARRFKKQQLNKGLPLNQLVSFENFSFTNSCQKLEFNSFDLNLLLSQMLSPSAELLDVVLITQEYYFILHCVCDLKQPTFMPVIQQYMLMYYYTQGQ